MSLAKLTVDFSGGCELLFHTSQLNLPGKVPQATTLGQLVVFLKNNYVKERADQFVDPSGTMLRPGILALVNDADCEVEGGMEYVLQEGDNIAFISTLHGG